MHTIVRVLFGRREARLFPGGAAVRKGLWSGFGRSGGNYLDSSFFVFWRCARFINATRTTGARDVPATRSQDHLGVATVPPHMKARAIASGQGTRLLTGRRKCWARFADVDLHNRLVLYSPHGVMSDDFRACAWKISEKRWRSAGMKFFSEVERWAVSSFFV